MSVRGRTCAGHTTLCFYSGVYTQEWKWTVVERAALHASGVWLQLIREASCGQMVSCIFKSTPSVCVELAYCGL